MEWEGKETSENVEDRRGMTPKMVAGGGIAGLIIFALAWYFTGDPNKAKQLAGNLGPAIQGGQQGQPNPPNDKMKEFAQFVIGSTDKVWGEQFRVNNYRPYEGPKMVIFDVQVETGCGTAPSAVGPFYCPADRQVYLDPTFFDELEGRLGGSKADFSKAYVIAHEVGHHVQNLRGYSRLVDEARGGREEKSMSVRLELQADYLAGVWAFHADKKYHIIERGDVESAIKTALAIGDDKLQKNARGWSSPESYTHGTAAQRAKYFSEGLKTGDASKARLDRFFQVQMDSKGELVDR
jgi:predicted metalloprotease